VRVKARPEKKLTRAQQLIVRRRLEQTATYLCTELATDRQAVMQALRLAFAPSANPNPFQVGSSIAMAEALADLFDRRLA
jgi:hypothetical protein